VLAAEALVNIRNGLSYRAGLHDGRQVFIDGQLAGDVTFHPAFRRTVASFAALYDFQARPENQALMTFVAPGSGRRVNRAWQLPTCYEELVSRRLAIEAWAELHHGFMGRSPDHLACALGAMVVGIEVFRRNGEARAQALLDYFAHVRDKDLFVAYVIQNPQADKTQGASGQARDLVARVVSEDSEGITLRGAKMLGTSAVMADELLVANIQPLGAGEERYAFSAALPMSAPGLRLLSRRSYEGAVSSDFDYPLSARFDENDAIVYFDEVKVPWSRVFLYGDVDAVRAQWADTPAHVVQNYQSQIRLMVKLRFLLGLARRIAETTSSIQLPAVRSQIGALAAQAALVEGMVYGMEAAFVRVGDYVVPPAHLLYAAQVHTQEMYPRFVNAIRDIAGGGLIMLPSSVRDFADPALACMIEATQVSAVNDALGRVKVFKLAWDALGSEFASRHQQYEMFYGGAPYVTQANMYRTCPWSGPLSQVDRALDSMRLPSKALDAE
jgi:4-hydroxyphenylacetate 3-monooxygenase